MTKLLIVDDNEQNLYMLRVLLEGHGYEVVTAANGAEALEEARRDPPDIIISDILMPVMDGFTLCRQWKKDEVLKAIPLVFYTATYTDRRDEEFALSLGAERFIVKPVATDVLVEMMREVIKEAEEGRLVAPREPPIIIEEEPVYLEQYSERLIKKLEDKLLQLEEANRAVVREITERKRAGEALRRSEKQASAAIEAARGFTFSYDIATGKITWGGAVEEITGYTPEEFAQFDIEGWAERIHPEDSDEALSILQEAIETLDRATAEYRFRRKDGSYVTLASISLTERENGKSVRLVGILQDITERKRAEEELIRLSSAVKTSVDSIVIIDVEGKIIDVNEAALKMYGIDDKEDSIGQNILDFVAPEQREKGLAGIEFVLEKGYDMSWGYDAVTKDGRRIPVELSATVMKDAHGKPTGIVIIARDITERKRAEEALRESEQRLTVALKNAPMVVAHVDRDLRYTWIHNPHPDFKPEDVVGKRDDELAQTEGAFRLIELKRQVLDGGIPARRESSFMLSGGERVYDIYAEPKRDSTGKIIGLTTAALDITERKQAEEMLWESEERFSGLYHSSKDAIGWASPDGTLLDVNDAFSRLTGYSREELVGKRYQDITPKEYEEWEAKMVGRVLRPGEPAEYEKEYIRKDGSRVPILLTVFVVRAADGKAIGVAAIIKDITERKRAEEEREHLFEQVQAGRERLRQLTQQVVSAQEEERRRLARELHDELGQALTGIGLDLAGIEKELPSDVAPTVREKLAEARSLAAQADERVSELALDLRPYMLDDLGLVSALRWYANRYAKRLDIEVEMEAIGLEERLPPQVGTALYRVVQEALTNVAKHAQANRVRIRLDRKESAVVAMVEDDGQGFDVETIAGPAAPERGAGLLGIRERANSLGGTLSIESTPGQGTRLAIEIPL